MGQRKRNDCDDDDDGCQTQQRRPIGAVARQHGVAPVHPDYSPVTYFPSKTERRSRADGDQVRRALPLTNAWPE